MVGQHLFPRRILESSIDPPPPPKLDLDTITFSSLQMQWVSMHSAMHIIVSTTVMANQVSATRPV